MIPSKANRGQPRKFDRQMYATRHLVENFFAKLKQFRVIAVRYGKTVSNFPGAVPLAASVTWLN